MFRFPLLDLPFSSYDSDGYERFMTYAHLVVGLGVLMLCICPSYGGVLTGGIYTSAFIRGLFDIGGG